MDPRTKGTLIPDKMPSGMRGSRGQEGGVVDLFFLVAIIAFVAALSLAAGVFLYHQFLSSSAAAKQEQIKQARTAFEPALISELLRLDSRLVAANSILLNHLAPSELFRLLQELTLQSVSYDSLEYEVLEDGTINLVMEGTAQSVNGVALQADVFGKHNAIVNPIFSDLDFIQDGVSFSVTAEINPSALRYVSLVNFVPTSALPNDFSNIQDTGSFNQTAGEVIRNTSREDDFGTDTSSFGDFGPNNP